jgi:hypothetical protein
MQIRAHYRRVIDVEVYCNAVTKALGSLAMDLVRPVDISRMVTAYMRAAPVAAMHLLSFHESIFYRGPFAIDGRRRARARRCAGYL